MIYGYYLPASREEFGVPELARRARAIWKHTERQLASDRDWEKNPPGRYDGASCWSPDGEESATIHRVILAQPNANTSAQGGPGFSIKDLTEVDVREIREASGGD
jgi:hypothetical protein